MPGDLAGSVTLYARAVDHDGASTDSAPVTLTVGVRSDDWITTTYEFTDDNGQPDEDKRKKGLVTDVSVNGRRPTKFTYSIDDLLSTITTPKPGTVGTTNLEYDERGNIYRQNSGLGYTTYTRNELGGVTHVTPPGAQGPTSATLTEQYPGGPVTSSTVNGPGGSRTVTYAYNDAG